MSLGNYAIIESIVWLANNTTESIEVMVEPWGESFIVEQGSRLEVHASGPDIPNAHVEVHLDPLGPAIWAWAGSTVKVYKDGVEVNGGDSPRSPVPMVLPFRAGFSYDKE